MRIAALFAACAFAGDWTAPTEIRSDEDVVVSYRARLDGDHLLIAVALKPGWHTFVMDNKIRADEKLAGKKALGADRPTSITLTGGLETNGPWRQSPPQDFSKPELRIFTWGYEKEGLFAVPVKRAGAKARAAIRAQACTEAICREINTAIEVAVDAPANSSVDLSKLIQVRTQ
jgi:DsbC/DsbD-like thiol-disulfide interchange protein